MTMYVHRRTLLKDEVCLHSYLGYTILLFPEMSKGHKAELLWKNKIRVLIIHMVKSYKLNQFLLY